MSRPLSRAAAASGVALLFAVAGCSSASDDDAGGGSALPTPVPSPTATATPSSEDDLQEYIDAGPGPLDPGRFGHAQFVGAIDIQYQGDRSSESAIAADAKYEAFYGTYDGPVAGERSVVRLTAFNDPRDGDRLLRQGAVIDNITAPNSLVIGLHNVLEIEGGVEVNGEVFEGRVGGASGALEVGDRMTIWTPDPTYVGLVNRYVYEAVPAEDGGAYALVDADRQDIEEFIYRAPAGEEYQLTAYTCWPPNQLAQRMVTRLHLVESAIERGSVSPVDPAA